jgi:low temperature requirement protein LtrA
MVEQRQAQRRGRALGGVRSTSEDHRATPLELLFDLVYVFAVTQVTGYMAEEHSAHGVLQGLLLLTLLWWTWSGYTWLGNQARADAILGVAAAVGLWWLYFDMVSLAAEQRLLQARGQARVDLAVEAYTYGHFPLVAGIVLAALGVEACWPTPVRASRWAPSTPSRSSAASRCTSPGSCCSSAACTTR